MSITTVTPENVDAYGRFTVVTRTLATGTDSDPATGLPFPISAVMSVHREPLAPGAWDGTGAWVPTSVTDQDTTIQAFAAALWSSAVVAAFKAAFPYVAAAAAVTPATTPAAPLSGDAAAAAAVSAAMGR